MTSLDRKIVFLTFIIFLVRTYLYGLLWTIFGPQGILGASKWLTDDEHLLYIFFLDDKNSSEKRWEEWSTKRQKRTWKRREITIHFWGNMLCLGVMCLKSFRYRYFQNGSGIRFTKFKIWNWYLKSFSKNWKCCLKL